MIRKEFIVNELKYRYPEIAGTIHHPTLQVGRPLIFENDGRYSGAHVIVCTADELNRSRLTHLDEPLFLCIGMPNQQVLDILDVFVLPDGEHVSIILNFVQRLFDRLDEWLLELKLSAESVENVDEFLVVVAEMIQNPIFLIDELNHLVAQSDFSDIASVMPNISDIMHDANNQAQNSIIRVSFSSGEDALVSHITTGDRQFKLVVIAKERPLYGSDEVVFEAFSAHIRLMLSEQKLYTGIKIRTNHNSSLEEALRTLLLQKQPDQTTLDQIRQSGWHEEDSYAIIAADSNNGVLRSVEVESICLLLESRLSDCCAFATEAAVIAVVKMKYSETEALQGKLRLINEEENIRFGICDTFPGFRFFSQRYRQSKYALIHSDDNEGVICFSHLAEQYIASQTKLEYPVELICMRSVLEMSKHDLEHHTNYVETAERYIKNRFNAVKTANELFIHRSTFLYRLDRIKTQFDLDLDDCDLPLLHLLLSLKYVQSDIFQAK